MHKVVTAHLLAFSKLNNFDLETESRQFEHFTNYCAVSKHCADSVVAAEIATPDGTQGIDGMAVLFDGTLVLTKDDATAHFDKIKKKGQIAVEYVFSQAKTSDSFDSGDMLKFGTTVRELIQGKFKSPDCFVEFIKIHSAVVDNISRVTSGRPSAYLYYQTGGAWKEGSGLEKTVETIRELLQDTGDFTAVVFSPVGREELIELWQQTREPVEATFTVDSYLPIPQIDGVEEAYLALAHAEGFVRNVLSEKDGRIKASIFDQNVRSFLGEQNPVNEKIKETVSNKSHHDRFALLNNGITIVSPDIRVQSQKISVRSYQIVNGCQTSHVLFRSIDALSDKMLIPLKLIGTSSPDLLAQVVRATNSQTDIEDTQFLSIEPFVQQLSAYFEAFNDDNEAQPKLMFERRSRQFAENDVGQNRIFDIPRLARCFASMFLEVPNVTARYPTQVFFEKRSYLFQSDHVEKAYYTAALALYRLENAFSNRYVDPTFQSQKWHILMVFRRLHAGADMPSLNSKKLEKYCDTILKHLSSGGKASAPPFKEVLEFLDAGISRDKLRAQKYTDTLRKRLVAES